MNPWIIVCIVVAALGVGGTIVIFFLASVMVFRHTIYRSPKKKRTRECTNTKDESQMRMFSKGIAWAEQYKDKTEELHIVNDGLNLYGEYINLGFNKCVVILQGRTESLLYSYYFADVYVKNGYNILVIDVRAHGLSDGKFQTAGIKESNDLVLWVEMISKKYSINDFTLHGICVGGASAVYTYVKLKNKGSNLVKRIVTDGMFYSNYEIFKRNFKAQRGPVFPALQLTFLYAFLFAKIRLFKENPIKYIKDIDIPILFIWSVKDTLSIKEKSEKLFKACASEHKELCFFPEGRHSHVRATQEKEYDRTIAKFLQKHK